MSEQDHVFMQEAIFEAKKAFECGEVPVGAVLVFEGKIIARGHNLVEASQDATCHAEVLCLKKGAEILGNWRLKETTLYCTLEPCIMCAGAVILSRVKRIVYGAKDLRHGADGSIVNVLNRPHPIHQVEICGGVGADEAKALMQKFFQLRRQCEQRVI